MRVFFGILLMLWGLAVQAGDRLPTWVGSRYNKLVEAQQSSDVDLLSESRALYQEVQAKGNDYSRWLVGNLYLRQLLNKAEYAKAWVLCNRLLQIERPEQERVALYKLAAQLAYGQEQWRAGLGLIERWFAAVPEAERTQPSAAELYLLKGYLHYQLGQLQPAVRAGHRAIRLKPSAPSNWYQFVAGLYQQLDQPAKAIPLVKVLLAREPGNNRYWRWLAQTEMQRGRPLNALSALASAWQSDLLPAEQWRFLAQLYLQQGAAQQAARVLEQGLAGGQIKANSGNRKLLVNAYLLSRQYPKAIGQLQQLAEQQPKKNSGAKQRLARLAFQQGDWGLTSRAFADLTSVDDQDRLLWGISLIELQRWDQAETVLAEIKTESWREQAQQWRQQIPLLQRGAEQSAAAKSKKAA